MHRVVPLASLLFAVALPLSASAQDGFRGWDQIRDPAWHFDPDKHVFRSYQVTGGNAVRELLERFEALKSEGALVPALRELQELIDDHGAAAIQVAENRYVGAAEYARWLLLSGDERVRAAYEKLAELRGRDAFERARSDGDRAALRIVARRYATARVGAEALLAMAELAREQGDAELSALYAGRLLDFTQVPSAGAAPAVAALAEIATKFTARAQARPPSSPEDWPTYGGDASRARRSLAPAKPPDFEHSYSLPVEHVDFADVMSPLAELAHSPTQPIRIGERLYVNNSLSVRCYDLIGRTLLWERETAQARVKSGGDDGFLSVADYLPNTPGFDDPTVSRALITGLSAGRGVILANVQVPRRLNIKYLQQNRINDPCPWRGLVALDAKSGAILWEQRPLQKESVTGRLDYGERRRPGDPDAILAKLDIPSPPAIVDGVAYALGHFFEGAVNTYLAALDLETGEPLFVTPLVTGQEELSMFNMPFQEFTIGVPARAGATICCTTNVGLVAAVDAAFGDLRWLAAYDAIPIEQPGNFFQNRARPVYWYNRGALVEGDTLLVTPNDARALFSLDPATGKERWVRELAERDGPRRGRFIQRFGPPSGPLAQLVGISGGAALYTDAGAVVAIGVDDGLVRWSCPPVGARAAAPIDPSGSGVIAGDLLFLPTLESLVVIDAKKGAELERVAWPGDDPRNVLVFRDMLIAASRSRIDVAFEPAEALRTLREQVARSGASLDLLLRIGGLERQSGELAAAAETFRRALDLAAAAPHDEQLRARAARCATLQELAAAERRATHDAIAERALIEAEALADDADARAAIVRELLARSATDPADARALRWLERLRADFPRAKVAVPELAPRPVTVAIFVALELARRHVARGEFPAALTELTALQSDWPAEPLAAGDSATLARQRVAELLAAAPAAVRDGYENDARAAFESAVEASDVERLALLLRRYPGSASAPLFATKELTLLCGSGRPADALLVGAELLRSAPGRALEQTTRSELARAAMALGNRPLARAFAAGVSDRTQLAPELAELLRTETAAVVAGGPLVRQGDVLLAENSALIGSVDRPLRGEPLPAALASILAIEAGIDLNLVRVHLPDGAVAWRQKLARPRASDPTLQVLHVAQTIVVKRGTTLQAFDLASGAELWHAEFDRDVPEIGAAGGMALVVQRTSSKEESEPEPVTLSIVEPRSGRFVATLPLAGNDFRVSQLFGAGPYAVVSSLRRSQQVVEVFDAPTGARRLDPRAYPPGFDTPLCLPDAGLLIAADAKPSPGELGARGGGVEHVNGWRLGGGEKAFEVDLLPFAYRLKKLLPIAGGFAILGGNVPNMGLMAVDPGSGNVRPPQLFPAEVTDGSKRILVAGEEAELQVLAYADWRKGDKLALTLLGADGRVRWSQRYEVPKNTVTLPLPDRLFRHGDALFFCTQFQAGGKVTDTLMIVDAASGTLRDSHSFEGGRPNSRADVVALGDWVVLRQESTVHVLEWETPR